MRALPRQISIFFGALVGLVLPTLATSQDASAYERQFHLGGGLGYSLVIPSQTFAVQGPLQGLGAQAHLTYGLSDTFNLLVELDGGIFPGTTTVAKVGANVGVGYVVDVLRWVPYIGLMAGGTGLFVTNDCTTTETLNCGGPRLSVAVPFGLDYQFSRSFAVGFAGKYGFLLLGPEGAHQALNAGLRAEYIWGY